MPEEQPNERKIARASRFLLIAVTFLGLIQIAGLFWPSYYTWGISFWSVVPQETALAIIIVCLLFLFPPISARIGAGLSRSYISITSVNSRPISWALITLVLILFAVLFFLFRSRALVYGDGFIVVSQFISDSPITGYQDYLKLFSIGFPRLLGGLFAAIGLTEPSEIVGAVNALGGAVAIFGLAALAKHLTESRSRQVFVILASLVGGATVLFFGYIEQYTCPTAMLLWSLWAVVRYTKRETGPLPMIVLSVITVLFHILTAPILLTVILAILLRNRENYRAIIRWAAIAIIAASFAIALLAQLFDLPTWLVLIWPNDDLPYSIISSERWVDLLNNFLLLVPLPLIAFLSGRLNNKDNESDLSVSLLGLTGLAGLLVMFWVEPKLGAARDFDFTSFYAIPLNLWATYRLTSGALSEQGTKIMTGTIAIALVLQLGGNLVEKNSLMLAGEHLDKIVTDCPQHSPRYGGARRALIWGVLLLEDLNRPDLALPHLRRRAKYTSSDASAWFNLGKIDYERERYRSAYLNLKKAVELQPEHPYYLGLLADVEYRLDRYDAAAEHIEKAAEIRPSDFDIQIVAGMIFARTGAFDRSLNYFRVAHQIDRSQARPLFNIGAIFDQINQPDSARIYLVRALNLDAKIESAYQPLIRSCLRLDREDEASRIYDMYQSLFPSVPSLEEIRKQL